MAIAFVQAATQVQVSGSGTTAPSITLNGTTNANALVLTATIGEDGNSMTISSVTDGGNTFVVRSGKTSTFSVHAVAAYAVNITGGNRTVAANLAGTSGSRYYTLGLTEWSGVATSSPEDTFDANDSIDTSVNDANAGPITTTDAGDLLMGTCSGNTASTNMNYASPASWTNRFRSNDASAFFGHDSGSWLPGSTQTTYTAQWTHDNAASDTASAVVVALKPAGGAVGSAPIAGKQIYVMP